VLLLHNRCKGAYEHSAQTFQSAADTRPAGERRLVMGQLLLGRKHVWLPNVLLNRSVEEAKLHKAVRWMQKPAGFVDRLLQPRLGFMVEGAMSYVIALLCLGVAFMMPAMELVPFSANLAGAALTAFGLALIARDGVLALIALVLTASIIAVVVSALF
jgi:hypothetical protein